jgi:hypothetical protein
MDRLVDLVGLLMAHPKGNPGAGEERGTAVIAKVSRGDEPGEAVRYLFSPVGTTSMRTPTWWRSPASSGQPRECGLRGPSWRLWRLRWRPRARST